MLVAANVSCIFQSKGIFYYNEMKPTVPHPSFVPKWYQQQSKAS